MDLIDLENLGILEKESENLMMPQIVSGKTSHTLPQRRELTLADKVEVIKFYEATAGNVSIRGVAKKFNIGRTAASKILRRKDEHLKNYSLNVGSNRRRIRHSKFHEVNLCTWKWFMVAKCRHLPVTGPRLQEKALRFATKLGISCFKASNGWLDSFKKAYNIQQQMSKSSEDSFQANFDWKCKLPNLTSDHNLEDVFCLKVIPLYFRALPMKSVLTRTEHGDEAISGERLMTILCCSALGEKYPPWVCGLNCHDAVNGVEQLGMVWKTSSDTNMNSHILLSFLENLNSQLQQKSRKILLFLDYMSVSIPELSHVTVHFFPVNTTAKCHPMDLGILNQFIAYYRKILLSKVLDGTTAVTGEEFHSDTTVQECLSWICKSWETVTADTIMKSFEDAGFMLPKYVLLSGSAEQLYKELASLVTTFANVRPTEVMSAEDYISFDRLTTTECLLTEQELEDQIAMEAISERNASPEDLLSLNIETDEEELQYYPEDETQPAAPGSDMTHEEALESICKLRNFALQKENCLLPLINDLKGLMEALILEQAKKKLEII